VVLLRDYKNGRFNSPDQVGMEQPTSQTTQMGQRCAQNRRLLEAPLLSAPYFRSQPSVFNRGRRIRPAGDCSPPGHRRDFSMRQEISACYFAIGCSAQEEWGISHDSGHEVPQRTHYRPSLSHGGAEVTSGSRPTGRLVSQSRPKRRVSPRPASGGVLSHDGLPISRKQLSFQRSSIWTIGEPMAVHQDVRTNDDSFPYTGYTLRSIPRRPADIGRQSQYGVTRAEYRTRFVNQMWLGDELKEISNLSNAANGISGDEIGHDHTSTFIRSLGQTQVNQAQRDENSQHVRPHSELHAYTQEQTRTFKRTAVIRASSSDSSSSPHASTTQSNSFCPRLGTQHTHPGFARATRGINLDTRIRGQVGWADGTTTTYTQGAPLHRCLPHRMGGTSDPPFRGGIQGSRYLEGKDIRAQFDYRTTFPTFSNQQRLEGQVTEAGSTLGVAQTQTHQFSGVGSDEVSSNGLSNSTQKSSCILESTIERSFNSGLRDSRLHATPSFGQLSGDIVPASRWRTRLVSINGGGEDLPDPAMPDSYSFSVGIRTQRHEQNSRCAVKILRKARLPIFPNVVSSGTGEIRSVYGRQVRRRTQRVTAQVQLLAGRPRSGSGGRLRSGLDVGGEELGQPSISSDWESYRSIGTTRCQGYDGRSTLAKSDVDSQDDSVVRGSSLASTVRGRNIQPVGDGEGEQATLADYCLPTIWKQHRPGRPSPSADVVAYIAEGHLRPGSIKLYNSVIKRWVNFATLNNYKPFPASVEGLAAFLVQDALRPKISNAFSAMRSARSALRSMHSYYYSDLENPTNGLLITRVIRTAQHKADERGCFRRKSQPLSVVALDRWACSLRWMDLRSLTLKQLLVKTIILIAFFHIRRLGDFNHLKLQDVRDVSFQELVESGWGDAVTTDSFEGWLQDFKNRYHVVPLSLSYGQLKGKYLHRLRLGLWLVLSETMPGRNGCSPLCPVRALSRWIEVSAPLRQLIATRLGVEVGETSLFFIPPPNVFRWEEVDVELCRPYSAAAIRPSIQRVISEQIAPLVDIDNSVRELRITCHGLRSGGATTAVLAGYNHLVVAYVGGWSSIDTFYRDYIQPRVPFGWSQTLANSYKNAGNAIFNVHNNSARLSHSLYSDSFNKMAALPFSSSGSSSDSEDGSSEASEDTELRSKMNSVSPIGSGNTFSSDMNDTAGKFQRSMSASLTFMSSTSNASSSSFWGVEKVLRIKGNPGNREFRVRWIGFSPRHDCWVLWKNLSKDLQEKYSP